MSTIAFLTQDVLCDEDRYYDENVLFQDAIEKELEEGGAYTKHGVYIPSRFDEIYP